MATSSSRASRFLFPLAAAVLLLALPLGAWWLLRAPVAVPPPVAPVLPSPGGPPASTEALVLRLTQLEGTVEVRVADGAWQAAREGQSLAGADAVRTGERSRAVLVCAERYDVRLEAGTLVSISELTTSISRLLLERGMATAHVRGARHLFEVRAGGSDAVARTGEGRFTISNDGRGTVAVASRGGEVELQGGGRVVVVREGEQSLVLPGQGPSQPAPIPSSLLLKVQWPAGESLRSRRLVVSGRAEPGSLVEVEGTPLQVGAEGTFSHAVPLREGANRVEVRARAVGGTSAASVQEVPVDTTPPPVGFDPDLWSK